MRLVKTVADFPANASIRTGFIPTMGALHEGHLSLIRRSKTENDRTVVSIFVNPTQFGPGEDFSAYPRPFERDHELASGAGADIVFAPEAGEIFGENSTAIHVPYVTDLFEGATRPGHFVGVATVVAKLLNIVSPKNVYFGEKDLQQCAVIRRMACDLFLSINIIICETIREESGLAKSSRNAYLTPEELEIAPLLHQALVEAKMRIKAGEPASNVLKNQREYLSENTFDVDYVELVDRLTMHPIVEPNEHASLIVAAKLGTTRLIDNIRVAG